VAEGETMPSERFDPEILVSGVSVYEVIKVKERTPLFFDDHVERLLSSLIVAGATEMPAYKKVTGVTKKLISVNNLSEGNIRILVHFDEGINGSQKLFAWYTPHYYPTVEEYASGIRMVAVHTERHNLHSKIIDIKFRAFIAEQLKKENAFEALLVDKDGFFTEGSKSNFFVIRDNKVSTAPEKHVLPGITRKYVMEICRRKGIETVERLIHHTELENFESCFISGTSPGVIAINAIGPASFSPGHPVIKKLMDEYESLTGGYIDANRSRFNK